MDNYLLTLEVVFTFFAREPANWDEDFAEAILLEEEGLGLNEDI